jgi:hypothetical protein
MVFFGVNSEQKSWQRTGFSCRLIVAKMNIVQEGRFAIGKLFIKNVRVLFCA